MLGTAAVPEEGQLVLVRDRYWVVKSVIPSALPLDVTAGDRRQHLVALSSVEDDGMGEELTVIWEIESGTAIREGGSLPTPRAGYFDAPERLRTFLDAVRWGAVASADSKSLQAPFRSGVTIEDYQLDPVVRALEMARVNLLIADDVGLGKTIEAGLIIQELALRHRIRTAWVLCPPSLCLKWKQEMYDRFGLEFRIVDAEAVRLLRRERGLKANIFAHFPRLIVSFDWLKMERPMRLLREYLPVDRTGYPRKIDMLVVDEAHQCAPAGKGLYARPSDRTRLLQDLSPHAEHRLFLTATPHNGYRNSFTTLLELLDPQRFARGVDPDPAALQNARIRRMKAALRAIGPEPDGNARFPQRVIDKIEVNYPKEEREIHELLERYAASRREQASSKRGAVAAELVTLLLKKRLFSSPAAFAHTLEEHRSHIARGRSAGGTDADPDMLRAAYDRLDDDYEADDDLDEAERDLQSRAARVSDPLTAEQQRFLDRMSLWARQNSRRADEKARALIAKLRSFGDERVIVFTEYRDTQRWVHELLVAAGLNGNRVRLLYGGMNPNERELIKAAFQSDPANDPVRILLATDTASEGIDLQRHCNRMIHMEIPFNPNRLEQRNGRIDRHGQPQPKVFIDHFVGKGFEEKIARGGMEGDLDFLFRAAKKLETIREDLGSAGAVLANEVEHAMLGKPADVENARVEKRESSATLRAERELRERIEVMHERVLQSIEELGITPAAIERVVQTGLELGRQLPLEPVELSGGLKAFKVPDLTRSWASAIQNLYHPLTDVRLPITFDNAGADGREDVVLAHLGHPLVLQATRLLRAEIWAAERDAKLARVAGRLVDDGDLGEPVIILDARLVIIGSDGYRLHEQLFAAGGRLGGRGGFARLGVGDVERAQRARGGDALPLHHEEEIETAWERIREPLLSATQARASELHNRMMRLLGERAETEESSLRTVMGQLSEAISKELDDAEKGSWEQMRLFDASNPAERDQVKSDLAALRRRLADIPKELEREIERLHRRYESPRIVAFPAALTFLVPRRYAQTTLRISG